MPEHLTAHITEPTEPNPTEHFPYSAETLERLRDMVLATLETNGLRTDAVLFAGYRQDAPKEPEGEHVDQNGTSLFFFGDDLSLLPPASLSTNPELQEEHWMANPLRYALPSHTLGVYDRQTLDTLARGPYETDLEFGTYVYALSHEAVAAAKLLDIQLSQTTAS